MKIEHLIKAVNESQSNEDFAAMSKKADQIAANAKAKTAAPADNTIPFPKQPADASTTTPTQSTPKVEPAAEKPGIMQRAGDAAQGLSNIIQKGAANASDNIPGVANWAGNLAQNTAPGINKVTGAAGDVIGKAGQAVNTAASGLTKGVQGIGDLAGAVGSAVTTPLGAIAGGFKRGYQKAAGTSTPAAASSRTSTAGSASAGQSAVSDQEFNDLIARVQKLEQLANMRR